MKKNNLINLSISMMLLMAVIFYLSGCKEDTPVEVAQVNKASIEASSESGNLVTDWYTLQLDIIRKSDPSIPNAVVIRSFGYTGMGLYEAVRPGIKKSVSLSDLLNQMPSMPQKEADSQYSWPISANAAMAKLIAYFFPPAVIGLNQARLDSMEDASNDQFITHPLPLRV